MECPRYAISLYEPENNKKYESRINTIRWYSTKRTWNDFPNGYFTTKHLGSCTGRLEILDPEELYVYNFTNRL